MDFRFDTDMTDLRDGARSFLEGENTAERLRGLPTGGDPLALWAIAALGAQIRTSGRIVVWAAYRV